MYIRTCERAKRQGQQVCDDQTCHFASASSDMIRWGRVLLNLLLSSDGTGGGYYGVAFDAGAMATEIQFSCQTLLARLVMTALCIALPGRIVVKYDSVQNGARKHDQLKLIGSLQTKRWKLHKHATLFTLHHTPIRG